MTSNEEREGKRRNIHVPFVHSVNPFYCLIMEGKGEEPHLASLHL